MSVHDPRQTYSLTRHLTATPETQRDVGQFHQGPVLDRVHWRAAVLGRWNTRLAWAWIFMAEFVVGGIAVTLWLAWRDPGLSANDPKRTTGSVAQLLVSAAEVPVLPREH